MNTCDACSTPTRVDGAADTIVGCPLFLVASNYNAFYSTVDENICDLVSCLVESTLSELLSGFLHFIVPYGFFFYLVCVVHCHYHSTVYISEYITFYSVSVVLPSFLPKTFTIHKIEMLFFAQTLLPPSSALRMFS